MNRLTIDKIEVRYGGETLYIPDFFIDGESLQKTIKHSNKSKFKDGRFKEFFIPLLHQQNLKRLDSDIGIKTNFELNNNESHILPLYGCHDSCCIYIYLKLLRSDDTIIWDQFGRNTDFVKDDAVNNVSLDWLCSPSHFKFEVNNYKQIFETLN